MNGLSNLRARLSGNDSKEDFRLQCAAPSIPQIVAYALFLALLYREWRALLYKGRQASHSQGKCACNETNQQRRIEVKR